MHSTSIRLMCRSAFVLLALVLTGCATYDADAVIRGGTIYDGSGNKPYVADLAIKGDRIQAIGQLDTVTARTEIDASGLAVSPGFINMLSWGTVSLLHDGRAMSDIMQGVTLEVMGEGWSMGPLNDEMRQHELERHGDIKYDITWTTLGEYLDHLEKKGVSTNVASFVGATTVRIHEVGYENRPATPEELARMEELVQVAMEEGAMGVGSSIPYAPAVYAPTDELIALAGIAAEYDGLFTSHIRDEGNEIFAALNEFFTIVRASGIRGEIYHLKSSQRRNWDKLDEVFRRIEASRAEGLPVTADMYTYHASSTGLNYNFPAWVKEGGHDAWVERLKDPAVRERLKEEIDMIPPEDILLVNFRNPELRHLIGTTLAQVASDRGVDHITAMMDLIIEDDSRVGTVRFSMSEENVRKKVVQPWMAFCSDAGTPAPEGLFLNSSTHPRAYGSFARLLGKYVREEGIIPLEEAVRRLTSFPAENLKLRDRGRLKEGFYADVVVFDPATIEDKATFEEPHQLAVGVQHVLVNGEQVLKEGEHTGATPGRFVHGPGWTGWKD